MSILLWLKYFEKKMFESLFPLNCSSIDFDFVAGTLNFLLFRFHRRWKIIDFNLLLKFISVAVLFMGFLFRSLSFFLHSTVHIDIYILSMKKKKDWFNFKKIRQLCSTNHFSMKCFNLIVRCSESILCSIQSIYIL